MLLEFCEARSAALNKLGVPAKIKEVDRFSGPIVVVDKEDLFSARIRNNVIAWTEGEPRFSEVFIPGAVALRLSARLMVVGLLLGSLMKLSRL